MIVFDFSKADDSRDHNLLMKKLKDRGLNSQVLKNIKSMCTNPQAEIYFNGQNSKLFDIERGVAQGCKLSIINDLLSELSLIKSEY